MDFLDEADALVQPTPMAAEGAAAAGTAAAAAAAGMMVRNGGSSDHPPPPPSAYLGLSSRGGVRVALGAAARAPLLGLAAGRLPMLGSAPPPPLPSAPMRSPAPPLAPAALPQLVLLSATLPPLSHTGVPRCDGVPRGGVHLVEMERGAGEDASTLRLCGTAALGVGVGGGAGLGMGLDLGLGLGPGFGDKDDDGGSGLWTPGRPATTDRSWGGASPLGSGRWGQGLQWQHVGGTSPGQGSSGGVGTGGSGYVGSAGGGGGGGGGGGIGTSRSLRSEDGTPRVGPRSPLRRSLSAVGTPGTVGAALPLPGAVPPRSARGPQRSFSVHAGDSGSDFGDDSDSGSDDGYSNGGSCIGADGVAAPVGSLGAGRPGTAGRAVVLHLRRALPGAGPGPGPGTSPGGAAPTELSPGGGPQGDSAWDAGAARGSPSPSAAPGADEPSLDFVVDFQAPMCALQAAVISACHLYGRGLGVPAQAGTPTPR
jgi:hypothetical protein